MDAIRGFVFDVATGKLNEVRQPGLCWRL